MAHPFDLDIVQSGHDLVQLFKDAGKHISQNPSMASIKIDGLNVSIRLVNAPGEEEKHFVLDRGSNKPADVAGVSKIDLEGRFGKGHGMIGKAGTVLDIFNEAVGVIKPELVKLGLWDNPSVLFNMEYVESGKTNVQAYDKNFLAIHGLLEIKNVTPARRATTEIPYDKSVLQRLINKVQPFANAYNFKVLGSVSAEPVKTPDYNRVLSQAYSVSYSPDKTVKKTLGNWLKLVSSLPRNHPVKLANGKTVDAISKEIFTSIMNGVVLSDYLANPEDIDEAIKGFVVYLATMKLGEEFLQSYNSELGPASSQEGLVIRGLTAKPFKITGSFIVRGLQSSFRK